MSNRLLARSGRVQVAVYWTVNGAARCTKAVLAAGVAATCPPSASNEAVTTCSPAVSDAVSTADTSLSTAAAPIMATGTCEVAASGSRTSVPAGGKWQLGPVQ